MAASNIRVYTRIRMPSLADIVELAVLKAMGVDTSVWIHARCDVSMKPFTDDAPCMSIEELKECLACLKTERDE